ncbi:MAG TPA: hypothetical protein VFJ82_26690 [Longimicrobium sp.]|nr:hypothetical protein [Longimicrobium sp.]
MPREVQDGQGITWSCVEAYAGLSAGAGDGGEAARADGPGERYRVICTPSGGARSVELHLPAGWEESLDDEALLREIGRHSGAG